MMSSKTPIFDFVHRYAEQNALRMHMPGHKGVGPLGIEQLDITEVSGADSLYEAEGIIRESERIASSIFGCETFYSTEGSSQCIRAMLYLALLHAKESGRAPLVLAGRNAHKTFLSALALLDVDVRWIDPPKGTPYLSCPITSQLLDELLSSEQDAPTAVYLTSPDYLGNTVDVERLAEVCHRHHCLLLIDNAHGAYLKLLPTSLHPMDLGADICCASAHKTLPVLTGGAYLHLSNALPTSLLQRAKEALALFGSTSPSYLILQSLDAANAILQGEYTSALHALLPRLDALKDALCEYGYTLVGDEPLKVTVAPKSYGYTGDELAAYLRKAGIECEFCDRDFLVLMPSPANESSAPTQIEELLRSLPRRSPIVECPPVFSAPTRVLSVRQATLSPAESLPIAQCRGRVLARPNLACPPAVCIAVCGELIDDSVLSALTYYGVKTCTVVK